MCSEIYIDGQEATRKDSCWCPLSAPEDSETDPSYADLGKAVWAAIRAKLRNRPAMDNQVRVDLVYRLW